MTPAEIRLTKEHVTQKAVEHLAVYLDAFMKTNKQPSKDCVKAVEQMRRERCSPDEQAKQILCSIIDWFAYGN